MAVGASGLLGLVLRLRSGNAETGTPRSAPFASGLLSSPRSSLRAEPAPLRATTPKSRACALLTGRLGPPFGAGFGVGALGLGLRCALRAGLWRLDAMT